MVSDLSFNSECGKDDWYALPSSSVAKSVPLEDLESFRVGELCYSDNERILSCEFVVSEVSELARKNSGFIWKGLISLVPV